MTGVLLVYSGAFLLYSVMEVLGLMPQEVVSAGLTLPRLFSTYLGDPVSRPASMYMYVELETWSHASSSCF